MIFFNLSMAGLLLFLCIAAGIVAAITSPCARRIIGMAGSMMALVGVAFAVLFMYSSHRNEEMARIHTQESVQMAHQAYARMQHGRSGGHAVERDVVSNDASAIADRAVPDGIDAYQDGTHNSHRSPLLNNHETSRPEWTKELNWRLVRSNEGEAWQTAIHAGPEASGFSLEKDLDREIVNRLRQFLQEKISPDAASVVNLHERDGKLWRSRLVTAEHETIHERNVADEPIILHEKWLRLELDQPAQQHLRQRYEQGLVEQRLTLAGVAAGLMLAVLGTIFSYLKIDTATRGFYTGRLRFGTGLTILVILALGLSFFVS